jgi:hypothetical protein
MEQSHLLQDLYSAKSKYAEAITSWNEQREGPSWKSWVPQVQRMVDAFGLLPEEPLTEIGCACGNFVAALRALGFNQVRGYDVSEEFVTLAKSWGRDYIEEASADQSPIPGGVVCSFDALEHLPMGVLARTLAHCNAKARLLLFSVPALDIFDGELPDGIVREEYEPSDEVYEHYINLHRVGWEKLFAEHLPNFEPHPLSGQSHYFNSKAPAEFFAYQRKENV